MINECDTHFTPHFIGAVTRICNSLIYRTNGKLLPIKCHGSSINEVCKASHVFFDNDMNSPPNLLKPPLPPL